MVDLGEWHTRKVATVHSRMEELDRLVFSAGQDCSALVSVKLYSAECGLTWLWSCPDCSLADTCTALACFSLL